MEGYTEIFVWGSDTSGQLGLGTENRDKKYVSPIFCSFNILIKDISCGEDHSGFISDSGHVYCMGSNARGKLGTGDRQKLYSSSPCLVESISHLIAVKISCGWTHTAVVTNEGSLYTWGCGEFGVLSTGLSDDLYSPQKVFQSVQDVSCGARHMGIISGRELWMCGAGEMGQLGTGRRQNELVLTKVVSEKVSQVSCGIFHTGYLTESSEVFTMGGNSFGQLGIGSKKSMALPCKVAIRDCIKILCGNISVCVTNEGLYVWGTCVFGECLSPTRIKVSSYPIMDISIGGSFVVAVDSNSFVYAWGSNNNGELGLGDFLSRDSPTKLVALKGKKIKKISAGGSFVICLGMSNREKKHLKINKVSYEVPKTMPVSTREYRNNTTMPFDLNTNQDIEKSTMRQARIKSQAVEDNKQYESIIKSQLVEAELLINALQQENRLLKQEIMMLKNEYEEEKLKAPYEEIIQKIKETYLIEIKTLKKQLEDQYSMQQQLEKDLNMAVSHTNHLEHSLEQAQKQLSSQSNHKMQELSENFCQLDSENSELKSLLLNSQSHCQSLQMAIESSQQENSFLNQRISSISQDLQKSNSFIQDLQNSIETLNEIVRSHENSLILMTKENSALHETILDLQEKNKQVVQDFEKEFSKRAKDFKVKTLNLLNGQRSVSSRNLTPEDRSPLTNRKELSNNQQTKIKNAVNKIIDLKECDSPLKQIRISSPSRKSPDRPSPYKKVNEEFLGKTPSKGDLQGKINLLLANRSRIEKKLHLLQKEEDI